VTLSIESSDSFVASAADSIATGWSEPVPGREFHPLKSSAFHVALLRQPSQCEIIPTSTDHMAASTNVLIKTDAPAPATKRRVTANRPSKGNSVEIA
jgi:hypothetical protein